MNETGARDTPYKGLVPYEEEDGPFFFGRNSEREIIIGNLMASRLTLLYGASGVGKSSLLRAGVAHDLNQLAYQNLKQFGTPEFGVVVFNAWRDNPVAAIEEQINQSISSLIPPGKERVKFSSDPLHHLTEFLDAWSKQIDGELFIILDQFEEYFLYHPREDSQDSFASQFSGAVNCRDLRVGFLISIREDSLAKLDRFKGGIPNLFDNYLRIYHLDRENARAAIIEPLKSYNLLHKNQEVQIEEPLVEAVLNQVKTGEDMLGTGGRGMVETTTDRPAAEERIETSYLQLVMARLWQEEMKVNSRWLRLETLTKLGGAKLVVQTHVDSVIKELTPDEQETAARVFYYLVTRDGTKIAHTVSTLAEYTKLDEARVSSVLEKLCGRDARILQPVEAPPEQPEALRYQIRHDALAPAILDWRTRYQKDQQRVENEKRLAEERGKAQKRLEREQQRVRRLMLGGAVLSLLLVVMIVLGLYARHQKQIAQAQQQITQAQQVATMALAQMSVDPELSFLLASEAVKLKRTAYTEKAQREVLQYLLESHLRTILRGHQDAVLSAAFSPDGNYALTISYDKTARIWDVRTGQSVAELGEHRDLITDAAFSPDGESIVTASRDATARVWETATGRTRFVLKDHSKAVSKASFSPDGKYIVTASDDGTARLWNAETGSPGYVLSEEGIASAAFSPDSKFVVTANYDGPAQIWEVSTGKRKGEPLSGHKYGLNLATFSPDGRQILTASGDRTARIWNVNTGKYVELKGHKSNVIGASFSADGKYVVTNSENDEIVRVWAAKTGKSLVELKGHSDAVISANFSPDSKFVVTTSRDGTARVWYASTGQTLVELRGHTDDVLGAQFSADSKLVITASSDGTARIWEPITEQAVILQKNISYAQISPNGKYLVTVGFGQDEQTLLWNISLDEHKPQLLDAVEPNDHIRAKLVGHTDSVNTAAFSDDSKLVVTASADGTARIWKSTGTFLKPADPKGEWHDWIYTATFSPDTKQVVTGYADGVARVWDTSTGNLVMELRGHNDGISAAAFSPDGKRIVTSSGDRTAVLWDALTQQKLLVLGGPDGHRSIVYDAAFSPDGNYVATAGGDGMVKLWETNTGRLLRNLSGHTRSVFSASFSPDGKYLMTASADGSARVWETESGQTVAVMRRHLGVLNGGTFSYDGRFILTSSMDGTAKIYSCDVCASTGDLLKLLAERIHGMRQSLSEDQKKKYISESEVR